MIGKTILHYKILSKLGEGGMGVVYKAEDTKIKREVAIKFLPRQIAASAEERERFKIEAQAAGALNHSNIATIYAIEESNDETFIVMEYIKGQELKDKIDAGPLPIDDTLDAAIQIAQGLQIAHEAGVVHRDIKSSNIMQTERGEVKIMDFGLAKRGGQTMLTKEGTTLGTVAYMSPEQARGDDVDQRSDIFSLGVLLYEMLTGQLPFRGDYDQAVTYSILHEAPEPITGLRTGVPLELERIVIKCLKKDVSDRYQGANDLIVDLRALEKELGTKVIHSRTVAGQSQPQHRIRPSTVYYGLGMFLLAISVFSIAYLFNQENTIDSIAVLPFVNSQNDPEMDYLSDGITETLINKLSQLPQLRVMARNTIFRLKGQDLTAQQIGEQLNVKAVVMGEIVQRGTELRVVAELIDVSDGAQIWGDQFNRGQDDIFAIEDAISEQISASLRLRLSSDEKSRLVSRQTEDREAYDLYLKGRFFWNRRTGEDLHKALGYFEQAIKKDPNYALAYAGIAECYVLFSWYVGTPATESYPKAKKAALRALQIDDQLSEPYVSLAMTNVLYEWDWESAERNFVRSIQLDPNSATAHQWYAFEYLSTVDRYDDAFAEMKRALELDPLSLIINSDLGLLYYYARAYDLAIEQLQKTIEMDQHFFMAHFGLGLAYIFKGEISKGIAALKIAGELDENPMVLAAMGYGFGISGDIEEAENTLVLLRKLSAKRYVTSHTFAMVYAGLGDKEKVMDYLQQAIEQRFAFSTHLNVDPFWDRFRDDHRFIDLLKKVGLAE